MEWDLCKHVEVPHANQFSTQGANLLSPFERASATVKLEVQYAGARTDMTLRSPWVRPMLKLHNLERAEVAVRAAVTLSHCPVFLRAQQRHQV